MVEVEDDQGVVFARGFCQFSSSEVKELLGQENQFVQTSFLTLEKARLSTETVLFYVTDFTGFGLAV